MTAEFLGRLRGSIEAAAGGTEPEPELRFHRHSEYLSCGLGAADLRSVWRQHQGWMSRLGLLVRLELAEALLEERIGELGHTGIHLLALGVDELGPKQLDVLDRVLEKMRGWSEVDHLCHELVQPLLRRLSEVVLRRLDAWSCSPIRWKRRASVVTFTRRIAREAVHTAAALRICRVLANDPEDIVQKGVGWALRDNLCSAPATVLPVIKELRRMGAPSTVVLYAIRDLEGKTRQEVLRIERPR